MASTSSVHCLNEWINGACLIFGSFWIPCNSLSPPSYCSFYSRDVQNNPIPHSKYAAFIALKTVANCNSSYLATTRLRTQNLLMVVPFCKLRLFPILVSHLQAPSSFAHFSFNSVIYRMEHCFSVLPLTDGQKAVCFMSFSWAPFLLQTHACSFFSEWHSVAKICMCIHTHMLPYQKYTCNKEWAFLTLL